MPTTKIAATKNATAKNSAAKKVPQPVAAATFHTKIDLANLAVGAKTVKQLARAVAKLPQTLDKMNESGAVKLEQPVTAKGALLATTDAKAAKRLGMEEGRAPRAAKTAAPAAKKTVGATQTAAAPAPAKKAAGKNAARKTGTNGSKEPARVAGGESAAAPEVPPATNMPGAEAAAS